MRAGARSPIEWIRLVAGLILAMTQPVAASQDDPLSRGDTAWRHRARGSQGELASPQPIAAAVTAFERALELEPESLEIRNKLLRALAFQGDYATSDHQEKKRIYARGRQIFTAAVERLTTQVQPLDLEKASWEEIAERLAGRPSAGALYFWGAVHWGLWAETHGKMAAVRQGVARRIRDYARIAIALDPEYESGGGHRLLGQLHAEAPKVPLITGWVSRKTALRELERALKLDPDEHFNRLFLAHALLRYRPQRRGEAVEMLEELVEHPPRPLRRLEDARARREARTLLREHREE